jgi:3',5'-cyclic-nucleotide phosphodiesterase
MTTFLIDGVSCLDAGALTEALPIAAQRRLKRIFLTHAHFDHIASLPFLLENLYGRERPLELLAPRSVLSVLSRDVLNGRTWPDFRRLPSPARPTVRLVPLEEGRPHRAGSVRFTPVRVDHVVPAFGYVIAKSGSAVVFSGDTRPTERIWRVAARTRDLKAVFLEVSFSDAQAAIARASQHLTPSLAAAEVAKAPDGVPVYLYHMKPPSLSRIRREVAALKNPRMRLLEGERSFRF